MLCLFYFHWLVGEVTPGVPKNLWQDLTARDPIINKLDIFKIISQAIHRMMDSLEMAMVTTFYLSLNLLIINRKVNIYRFDQPTHKMDHYLKRFQRKQIVTFNINLTRLQFCLNKFSKLIFQCKFTIYVCLNKLIHIKLISLSQYRCRQKNRK